mgnify:CR=1 FL=1
MGAQCAAAAARSAQATHSGPTVPTVALAAHTVDPLSPLSPHHRLSAGHLCLARGRLGASSAAQPQPARAARLGASADFAVHQGP